MRRPAAAREKAAPRDPGSGFVLVGVVMFVLALTILGLSLFSLSSFEAQFLSRSSHDTQVLYDATGGVEWAKMVLAREKRLEAVADGQPAAATRPTRVTWVEAWQNGNTTGGLAYGDANPIRIRALGEDGMGSRRMIEVQFVPNSPDSTYGALVDSYGAFSVPDSAQGTNRRNQTRLYGPVRVRNDIYPDWRLAPPPGGMIDWGHNAPQPRIDGFIAQHSGSAMAPTPPTGSNGQWALPGAPTGVNFFKTSGTLISVLEKHPNPTVTVSGTCVWMLDHGIRVDSKLEVLPGGANARLIIVSKRIEAGGLPVAYAYNPPPYVGIWLRGGLNSPTVPVVLVSDSQVLIETLEFTAANSTVEDLTVFASGVRFTGPEGAGIMRFVHDTGTDSIIQELAAMGALPGANGSSAAFDPIPGTWRELDPDNPS